MIGRDLEGRGPIPQTLLFQCAFGWTSSSAWSKEFESVEIESQFESFQTHPPISTLLLSHGRPNGDQTGKPDRHATLEHWRITSRP